MPIRDEDGIPIKSGDHITFCFGIPPISVLARVTGSDELHIECISPPDVQPKREKLSTLMKYYQVWKASPQRVQAASRDYSNRGIAS